MKDEIRDLKDICSDDLQQIKEALRSRGDDGKKEEGEVRGEKRSAIVVAPEPL